MEKYKNIPIEAVPLNFPLWKTSDNSNRTSRQESTFHMNLCGQAQSLPRKFYKPIRPSFFLTIARHDHDK